MLCSPRTRGWSLELHPGASLVLVFPAHAGMVLPVARDPGAGVDSVTSQHSMIHAVLCFKRQTL